MTTINVVDEVIIRWYVIATRDGMANCWLCLKQDSDWEFVTDFQRATFFTDINLAEQWADTTNAWQIRQVGESRRWSLSVETFVS